MKRLVVILCSLLLLQCLSAQKVLLQEDPAIDTTKETVGPNLKHFFHPYYGYGLYFGKKQPGAKTITGNSYSLTGGIRYKRRFSDFYSLGGEFALTNTTYSLKQQAGKILPDSILHKKERLSWMYVSAAIFNRFNLYKRGNVMGAYFDLGVEAGYSFSFTHFYFDRANNGQASRTRVRGLDYYQPYYYSVFARFGLDRVAISCSYRLSGLFKDKYNYPNLPPLCISLQLSVY